MVHRLHRRLMAGLVDDLRLAVVPVLLGGGLGLHYQRR
jgi:hypothetical protein